MNYIRALRTTNMWTHSLKTLTLIAWLGVWTQRTAGQGPAAEVLTGALGQTAALRAPFTADILSFSWYKGTGTLASQQIIGYVVPTSKQITGPLFTGRESVTPDGTLTIRDLRSSDNGTYTVSVTLMNTTTTTAYRQLRVYEPVTKPRVTWVPSQLVENKGPAEITCNDSTAATTILWSFNKSSNLPGNILPSPDNRTLRITNVSREDSGTYQCVAMNPVSRSASDPQTLIVAYGPEGVRIEGPVSHSVQNGTRLSLSCTAGSVPEPSYQWSLNGTDLKRPGQTYTVEKVSSQDEGTYTCVTHNTLTGLSAKAYFDIDVTEYVPTVASKIDGLSDGAIAGIVIAALVVLAGMAALVYIFVFKKPASGAATTGNSTEMAPNNNEGSASPKANGTAAEIQYSSVNFVPKRGTPAKPVAPENTVYSEVRR